MKQVLLKDLNIYKNESQTYIGRGDGFLSVIQGEEVPLVNSVLEKLISNDKEMDLEILENQILNEVNIDSELFNEIILWLKGSGIIQVVEEQSKVIPTVYIEIYGLSDKEEKDYLLLTLVEFLKDDINLSSRNLEDMNPNDQNLVLLFSSILNKDSRKYARKLYDLNIPHIYLDFSPYSVTIGPAVIPSLKTPCLMCFTKRRISNTGNPSKYLQLIQLDNEVLVQQPLKGSNFFFTLCEWLTSEISRLASSNWKTSGITAKTKSMNFATDELELSKILRTPNCDVCNKFYVQRALNG